MSLLLDILVIAVFAFSVYSGIKKGFIRSVMGIVVVVLAILGSAKLTPPLAAYLHDNYIDNTVTNRVEKSLGSLISGVESLDLDKLFDEQPQAFLEMLDRYGADFDELKAYYEKDLEGSETADEAIADRIAAPLSETISRASAFALLFIGLMLVLSLLAFLINLLVKLPILNGANRFLGAVFGLVMGFGLAWGLSVAFRELLPHLSKVYDGVSPTIIENTVVIKYLGGLDFFRLF